MVLHFFLLQATKHLHVSYNNYIKENLCSTEDWKKVTPRDSEFYMASVDTMFSINSQEELSIKVIHTSFPDFINKNRNLGTAGWIPAISIWSRSVLTSQTAVGNQDYNLTQSTMYM